MTWQLALDLLISAEAYVIGWVFIRCWMFFGEDREPEPLEDRVDPDAWPGPPPCPEHPARRRCITPEHDHEDVMVADREEPVAQVCYDTAGEYC